MIRNVLVSLVCFTLAVSVASADTIIPPGYVSGTWTAAGSPYLVQGDIEIHDDSLLTIEPGVTVSGGYNDKLSVWGYLEAVGTAADSIIFDIGIRIMSGAPDSSHMAYARFSGSGSFARIECYLANPVITHCTLSDNTDIYGGVYLSASNPEISYCTISRNTVVYPTFWPRGGGIACNYSSPVISHCTISDNILTGMVSDNPKGGGIYCGDGSSPVISDCVISGNSTPYGKGGGVYCEEGSSPVISNCTISENEAQTFGGGIWVGGSLSISASTFSNNDAALGSGIFIESSGVSTISSTTFSKSFTPGGLGSAVCIWAADSVSFTSCTFDSCTDAYMGDAIYATNCNYLLMDHCDVVNNSGSWGLSAISIYNTNLTVTNCIFKDQFGCDIYVDSSASASVSYSDFYGAGSGPFTGTLPANLGEITATNVNGDSCDVYCNIYLDPLFVDFAGGDYHLTEDSPCIDAGDPAYPMDPDNTITDMGRYYFEQGTPVAGRDKNKEIPAEFRLCSPYPNPFNPVTTFKIELPVAAWVTLEIYDISGRTQGSPLQGWRNAGYHEVTFDAAGLASGLYVYRLEAGEFRASGKMVLIK
jgi:hypothetical protein